MPLPESDQTRWFVAEVQPHVPALRAWLRGKYPVLTDIDDLLQETFVRVLQMHAHDPDRIYAVKPLLFTTARNLALDELRRMQVLKLDSLPEAENEQMAEDRPGVSDTVGRNQELQLLTEAIQALPQRCRQVLTLRKIYGLPQKEIARQLGITEHTVEAQVVMGVKRCTAFLARFGLP
ncbi:MAG: sigma-70 family RNA polymerase sigma factor [Opitutaceae bacterium]|nr:sigma-70 family RNA polymerase sigma factor [Opitutaceae bacterium]